MTMDLSALEFIAKLGEMVIETEIATHEGLERAGQIVEREAKAEIGHYQEAAGPFQAWQELAESTKDDRVKHGYSENDPLLREGDLRDSIEHKVEGHTAYVGSDSPIAEYQELGTAHIPPRSFLAGALIRKEREVVDEIGRNFVGALIGRGVAPGQSFLGGAAKIIDADNE